MGVKVTGIYLAAGQSRRMGAPKLSIPLGHDRKLGLWAWLKAMGSKLEHIVVVTREEGPPDWLASPGEAPTLQRRCSYVVAEEAARGMAYSLQAGLQAAVEQGAPAAVVVVLADQPFIHTDTINRLIDAFRSDVSLDYVATGDRGMAKPPVLLASSMFEALRGLQGDEGARKLLLMPDYKGRIVEETDSMVFIDLDTPQDVERFKFII